MQRLHIRFTVKHIYISVGQQIMFSEKHQ